MPCVGLRCPEVKPEKRGAEAEAGVAGRRELGKIQKKDCEGRKETKGGFL
jgi:hypothetical protein